MGKVAGKVRHLLNRSGRYHARLTVPKELRSVVGKRELRKPLGGDYKTALKMLPGVVAELQHQIVLAERKLAGRSGLSGPTAPRYPLAPDQIAYSHYQQRLAFDDLLRNNPLYASVGIDDMLVNRLREAIAGRADDQELNDLVGVQIKRFRWAGNLDDVQGSDEWRVIARSLCHAELEALARASERDEGDFSGEPSTPMLRDATPPEDEPQRVDLLQLWEDYKRSRIQAGFMRDGGRRQNPVIENLRRFLKHADAARITKKDVIGWRDHLMKTLSAKTVSNIYLSTLKSLLRWANDNDLIANNPAVNVRQPVPSKQYSRERGYTDAEALKILKASRSYVPSERGRAHINVAKRWCPILCAFTGARTSEITQLRKEDVREENGRWVVRITPDAGGIKVGGYRDVPLHRQIVDEGFIDFIRAAKPGPLFHTAVDPEKFKDRAGRIVSTLAKWLHSLDLVPEGVQPNYAWRHRLKTQAREMGISDRVADAIQGHTGRNASDGYGDVTLKAKADLIDRLPSYSLRS